MGNGEWGMGNNCLFPNSPLLPTPLLASLASWRLTGASVFVIGWLLVLQLIDQSANKLLRDPFGYARRQVLEKFLEGGRRARVTQHADRLDRAKQNLR